MIEPRIHINTGSLFPASPSELIRNFGRGAEVTIHQADRMLAMLNQAGFKWKQVGLSFHPSLIVPYGKLILPAIAHGYTSDSFDVPDKVTVGSRFREMVTRPQLAKEHIGWFLINTPTHSSQQKQLKGFLETPRTQPALVTLSTGQIMNSEGDLRPDAFRLLDTIRRSDQPITIALELEAGIHRSLEDYMILVDALNNSYRDTEITFGYAYDPAHFEEMRRLNPETDLNEKTALEKLISENPDLLQSVDLNNIGSDPQDSTHKYLPDGQIDLCAVAKIYGKGTKQGVKDPLFIFEGNPADREAYITQGVEYFKRIRDSFLEGTEQ